MNEMCVVLPWSDAPREKMPLGGADIASAVTLGIGIQVCRSPLAEAGADGLAKGVDKFQGPGGAKV